jgi:hypothetical protein
MKREVWGDMQQVMKLLGISVPAGKKEPERR